MYIRWTHNQEIVSCLRAFPLQYCISEITGHIYNQFVIGIWNIWLENDQKNAWTEVRRSHRKLQATANSELHKFVENVKMLPHLFISFRWPGPPHYRGFTTIFRHITIGRTRMDEWTACCRDLYLSKHNIHDWLSFAPARIRSDNASKGAAADSCIRPRGQNPHILLTPD
jgi:hypothetical protein